jgi:hypothetical protein
MAFARENLGVFQMRGRASLRDGNLLANGPFVLWGSMPDNLLRGDFYGPDGKPVVSIRIDSAGALIYFPVDETAIYSRGGIPIGEGILPVSDLIHLLRTGFPVALEQWQVMDGAVVVNGKILWTFETFEADTLEVILEPGDLFPDDISWDSGSASITGSTYHDEFNAWPEKWILFADGTGTEISTTALISPAEPWDELWNLNVTIDIDTLAPAPAWQPAWEIQIR